MIAKALLLVAPFLFPAFLSLAFLPTGGGARTPEPSARAGGRRTPVVAVAEELKQTPKHQGRDSCQKQAPADRRAT